jgi:hypothetical protein
MFVQYKTDKLDNLCAVRAKDWCAPSVVPPIAHAAVPTQCSQCRVAMSRTGFAPCLAVLMDCVRAVFQRLQGKQKRCPACRSLLATYRKRTVPEYTYDIALTRLVATYIEYVASQVMQSSRAIVGACLQRAAVRKADAAAKRSIDLTAVPEQVAARSTHQCPLPRPDCTPPYAAGKWLPGSGTGSKPAHSSRVVLVKPLGRAVEF